MNVQQMKIQQGRSVISYRKQKGVTLFSVMMFLVLMTTIGVSSSKLALLDIMVASNDHKQMQNYQRTSNELNELTSVAELYEPLVNDGFNPETGLYVVPNTQQDLKQTIRDLKSKYLCQGIGLAISVGPDNERCYTYEFNAKSFVTNTGVRDRHVRGAGKEKPSIGKNSYLN